MTARHVIKKKKELREKGINLVQMRWTERQGEIVVMRGTGSEVMMRRTGEEKDSKKQIQEIAGGATTGETDIRTMKDNLMISQMKEMVGRTTGIQSINFH